MNPRHLIGIGFVFGFVAAILFVSLFGSSSGSMPCEHHPVLLPQSPSSSSSSSSSSGNADRRDHKTGGGGQHHDPAASSTSSSSTTDDETRAPLGPTEDPKIREGVLGSDHSSASERYHKLEVKDVHGIQMAVRSEARSVLVVNNHSIEAVDPRAKLSREYVAGYFKLLLPLVADHLSADHKRSWIDLGARFYPKGSTSWFRLNYPKSWTFEAHLFDVLDLRSGYRRAWRRFKSFDFHVKAAYVHDRGVTMKGKKMPRVSDHAASADNRTEWTTPSIDFAQFLKSRYTVSDFVVVKMDIEGGEWVLLKHLIEQDALKLIDELFLECHTIGNEPFRPSRMPWSCLDLTNHLRTLGVHAHRWV